MTRRGGRQEDGLKGGGLPAGVEPRLLPARQAWPGSGSAPAAQLGMTTPSREQQLPPWPRAHRPAGGRGRRPAAGGRRRGPALHGAARRAHALAPRALLALRPLVRRVQERGGVRGDGGGGARRRGLSGLNGRKRPRRQRPARAAAAAAERARGSPHFRMMLGNVTACRYVLHKSGRAANGNMCFSRAA